MKLTRNARRFLLKLSIVVFSAFIVQQTNYLLIAFFGVGNLPSLILLMSGFFTILAYLTWLYLDTIRLEGFF